MTVTLSVIEVMDIDAISAQFLIPVYLKGVHSCMQRRVGAQRIKSRISFVAFIDRNPFFQPKGSLMINIILQDGFLMSICQINQFNVIYLQTLI